MWVESRASALDGDRASSIAAICSALPTPGRGWSQTWSARRRDAPVLVERCESPEALRADRVEAADWGRCIGILCLGVGATAWGLGCPFGAWRAVGLYGLSSCVRGPVTPSRWRSPCTTRRFRLARTFLPPSQLRWALGRLGDVSVGVLCRVCANLCQFLIQPLLSSDRPPCCQSPHSVTPCHLCCSNAASRRRIAPAAIAVLTDCEPLHMLQWRTTRLSRAARVCEEMLIRSYNAQVHQEKWRRSTNS